MADAGNSAPAPDAAVEHTYKFNVSMSCGGCSGAVDRVLKKLEGASTVSLFHLALPPPHTSPIHIFSP
jgi:copper chaperone